jgi:hypothetical protein
MTKEANRTMAPGENDSTIEIIELRPQEVQLLKFLRNSLKFGEVVIKVRDGVPVRLVRIQEFIDLS